MKSLLIICITLALANAWPTNSNHHLTLNHRIVGGNVAQPHSLPYQVGILMTLPGDMVGWCGGSLISEQYVLTAAHCLDKTLRADVILGAHNLTTVEDDRVEIQTVSSDFIIHHKWNPKLNQNDIALIKLPYPVKLNDKIKTVKLPQMETLRTSEYDNRIALASGWGHLSDADESLFAEVLHYVNLNVIPLYYCGMVFPVQYSNICVNGADGKSPCSGDSGGPLVYEEKDGSKTLIGLTSYGSIEGCEKGYPGVYTRVSYYLDWISENTRTEIYK